MFSFGNGCAGFSVMLANGAVGGLSERGRECGSGNEQEGLQRSYGFEAWYKGSSLLMPMSTFYLLKKLLGFEMH